METQRPREYRRSGVAALRHRIEAWRSTCTGPQGRMPERLWREAVLLAGEHGLERVASSLGLNRLALKRRLGTLEPAGSVRERPVFLDVTPPLAPSLPSALEVLARDGTRLRFHGPLEEIRSLVLSVLEHAP